MNGMVNSVDSLIAEIQGRQPILKVWHFFLHPIIEMTEMQRFNLGRFNISASHCLRHSLLVRV